MSYVILFMAPFLGLAVGYFGEKLDYAIRSRHLRRVAARLNPSNPKGN